MIKKITISDSRTGEIMEIEYDFNNHIYSINGIEVIRQTPLEVNEDEYVFSSPDGKTQKLYHIMVDDLKELWEA